MPNPYQSPSSEDESPPELDNQAKRLPWARMLLRALGLVSMLACINAKNYPWLAWLAQNEWVWHCLFFGSSAIVLIELLVPRK